MVAEKSGTSASYISEVESGAANPTLQTTERLAHGLGVEVCELFLFRQAQAVPEQIRGWIKAVADKADDQALCCLSH